MTRRKITLTVNEKIVDEAKIKAIREKTSVSKAVDVLLWAWVTGQIDLESLPKPPEQGSPAHNTE